VRIKIDENLPSEVAELLSGAGHDVSSVLAQSLGGVGDRVIASVCAEEDRILLTLDTDFADIRAYPPADYPGIIVLRLRGQEKHHILLATNRLSSVLEKEAIQNQLWIVEEDRIRIRK
jgi:predicted nuclease of predicted toxin-antitoxin system